MPAHRRREPIPLCTLLNQGGNVSVLFLYGGISHKRLSNGVSRISPGLIFSGFFITAPIRHQWNLVDEETKRGQSVRDYDALLSFAQLQSLCQV